MTSRTLVAPPRTASSLRKTEAASWKPFRPSINRLMASWTAPTSNRPVLQRHADAVARGGLGVESPLEHLSRTDELGRSIRYAIHHRVLTPVVREDGGTRQQLGEVEVRRGTHAFREAFGQFGDI